MEIKELYKNLLKLGTTIKPLLDSINYRSNTNLDLVTYDENNADDCMLIEEFRSIFTHIDYVDSVLAYLQQPIIDEGILDFIENGKHQLNQKTLMTNDVVEIFYIDEDSGTGRWKPIILRPHSNYNGKKARLRTYKDTPLQNLP